MLVFAGVQSQALLERSARPARDARDLARGVDRRRNRAASAEPGDVAAAARARDAVNDSGSGPETG